MRRSSGLLVLTCLALGVVASSIACAKKQPDPANATVYTATEPSTPPLPPPCQDQPFNPSDVLAKEPGIVSACVANAGKLDTNLCGSAKIAVKIGKNGKVQSSEVAQSSLPIPVTDCIKARLAAQQYACPSDDSAVYTVPVGLPLGGPNGECPGMPAMPTGGTP